MTATTRSALSVSEPALYVAFELGEEGVEAGDDVGLRRAAVPEDGAGGDLEAVERAIRSGRARCGLPAAARW